MAEVTVVYNSINQTRVDMESGVVTAKNQPLLTQEEGENITLLYQASVNYENGEIVELRAAQQTDIVNWITKDIIRQVFPDLREENYVQESELKNGDSKKVIIKDNLGEVEPRMVKFETKD